MKRVGKRLEALVNAANKPLIKTNGKIYAMPATIGSWGWFEALLTVVRNQEKDDKQKDIDKEVGKLIEYYINEKLDEKGITHCCGDYMTPWLRTLSLAVEPAVRRLNLIPSQLALIVQNLRTNY